VYLPASIPALLSSRKKLGAVQVEAPRVELVLYPDGSSNLTRIFAGKGRVPVPAGERVAPLALGFELAGEIAVRDGRANLLTPEGLPFSITDISTQVKVDSLNQPIAFELDAKLGKAGSRLEVKGSAKVMEEGLSLATPQVPNVAVSLADFDLAELAPLARQLGAPVDFGGKLDVQLTARFKEKEQVEAQGTVGIRSLALAGAPLGKDQPQFDSVRLEFSANLDKNQAEIQELRFESPVARGSVSGSLAQLMPGQIPTGSITAKADVDLAALARNFPHTLRLKEGLAIESGALALAASFKSDAKGAQGEAELKVENLSATQAGRRIEPEAPIVLQVKGGISDGAPKLDSLQLDSSFAKVRGSGSLERFALMVESNLGEARREAAKFRQLAGGRPGTAGAREAAHN